MSTFASQAATIRIEETLPADPVAVSTFLARLRRTLSEAMHPAATATTWELAMAEVLNNVVEHAYADTPGEPISLRLSFGPTMLTACVCDCGSAMPDLSLPEGAPVAVDCALDDLPEGGFGWNLIRQLSSELVYTRVAQQNRLTFAIPFDRPEAPMGSA